MRVAIIGAGPGGLAAAMLLAHAGAEVSIHERLDHVGGRCATIEARTGAGAFRFDRGPTFFLYPRVLAEIFRACGRDLFRDVELTRLDPLYRLVFGEGGTMDAAAEPGRLASEIARLAPDDAVGIPAFMAENRAKFAAFRPALETAFDSRRAYLKPEVRRALPLLWPPRSVDGDLGRHFRDPRVRLAFSFQSKYLGMSPFRCPSLFTILAFMEHEFGVWHPRGGCGELMAAMARAARGLGVRIHLDDPVQEILFDGRRAVGLRTPAGTRAADAVVINADFAHAVSRLVPDRLRRRWSDRRIAAKKFSCSTFMMYLGLEGRLDQLAHHTIYLARDYRANVAEIEEARAPPADPSFYVQNACLTDPDLAPPGHSTLYVLVPVGHRRDNGIDWKAEQPRYRRLVLDRLARVRHPRYRAAHSVRGVTDSARLGAGSGDSPRRDLQSRAHDRPNAASAAAQPVRGSRSRLSGWRRYASGKRFAGDFRGRAHHRAAVGRGLGIALWRHAGRASAGAGGGAMSSHLPSAVIGGGLGGLAAACTLAARGHRVLLLEKNGWLGGKAAVLEERGFRFDMGPTILTLPGVLARIFAEAGQKMDAVLDLRRIEPQWRCFFDDGSILDLSENVDTTAGAIDAISPRDAAGFRDFMRLAERLHGISDRFFFWRSVEDLRDTMSLRRNLDLATLSDVVNLRMGATVAGTIRRRIGDQRVAQMLDHFVQYVGSSPYGSPAVLCGIAHMQTEGGVWYPMGGTRAVPLALEGLARSLGVELRTGVGANRIVAHAGRVAAVTTDAGETIPVAAVVSNMDSVRTYRELIGGEPARRFGRRRRRQPACSGVVLYLGLDRAYDHLLHHSFVFSRDPVEEFAAIYDKGEPAPDPTCYLAAPARTEPDVAPPGGEALYILVHTPWLRPHHDWQAMLPGYRRIIFEKLARCAGLHDLENRIVVEHALTPADIHERYRVLNGAIYGLASHGRLFGAFKPGNRSRDLPGLYLAGGAAHPGAGMPMALMSGWIAADALDHDARTAREPQRA